jgi:hypothetical protein
MVSLIRPRTLLVLTVAWLMFVPVLTGPSILGLDMNPVSSSEPAAPTLTGPDYYSFENGSRGHTLTYSGSDDNPKNYTVMRDGTLYDDGLWSGGEITVYLVYLYTRHLIDTLPKTFNFTVTVFNDAEESASVNTTVYVYADVRPPEIVQPENITYEEGSFGHDIFWEIDESNPDFYNISRISNEPTGNASVLVTGTWDGSNITWSVDGLNASRWYLYTLFVNDTLGYNSTSTVNVTVLPDVSFPVVSSPENVSIEFGSHGHSIVWHIYDSNPKNYSITALILYNDTTYGNVSALRPWVDIFEPDWSFTDPEGQNVSVSLDGLPLGNYSIMISVFDTFNRETNDTVFVYIYRDIRPPQITTSGDLTYEEGYTGNEIEWSADESNPVYYNLTLNGEVLANGTWRGENYSLNVDHFAVGTYDYNMTFEDYFNQSSWAMIRVEVTPDAHLPTIAQVVVIQSLTTTSTNNLTLQAYVWDLNNISSIQVQWGVGNPESEIFEFQTANMTPAQLNDFYTAELGEYRYGQVVWYRLNATDNSSVMNVHLTEWASVVVVRQSYAGVPIGIYAVVIILGSLSLLVMLVLYFRTRIRGK